jgi:soluble lytic murein transglycosylase
MTYRYGLSQRRLLGCLTAIALILGAPGLSVAKPDETPAAKAKEAAKPAATKPAAKKIAKPDLKAKPPAKPADKKPAVKKPESKTAGNKTADDKTAAGKTAAKPADKKAAAKSADKKPDPKAAAKPAAQKQAAKPAAHAMQSPKPGAAPAKAALSPVSILPTGTFVPGKPMMAATTPTMPPSAVAPPPPVLAPAAAAPRMSILPAAPLTRAETSSTPAADVAIVKQAIDLVRRGKTTDATALEKTISDPLARKLVEWSVLRSEENDAGFDRLAAFGAENPSWPNATMIRRRAEGALWDEKRSAGVVTDFFAGSKPLTAKGKFALARALMAQGQTPAAAQLVRQAWREDTCSRDVERMVMETFGEMLTRADHKARMDRRLYDDDADTGMRIAQVLGGADLAIAKARKAVAEKSSNAHALLEAVPASARTDAGYIFSKAQWLRREDKAVEAGHLMLTAPRFAAALHDTNEWWTERRVLARKLLDEGEHQLAYRVARDAVTPAKDAYLWEHEFTAGWIALRFTNNPQAAAQHFARVAQDTTSPTTLARAEYWQGRAAEAAGRSSDARTHYQQASRFPTAYYGQIARAKLGMSELVLRRPPEPANRGALMNLEVVRATQILYAIDARDLVIPFVADLADRAVDPGALVVIAEIAKKHDDARAMLMIGKAALNRGYAFDVYAFPTNGIPEFRMVGPSVDRSVVYAIARQESAFNPRAVSSAKAYGLMQVTAPTGRIIAKKFGLAFDQSRMLSDAAYNAQMGSAELGDVLESYRGSYILSFVAYNAGRGRARQWIEKYGDPRDPNVDPIDWVERIPFSETRNYVQRVLENMQVYRAQLGGGSRLLIEADLRRGAIATTE